MPTFMRMSYDKVTEKQLRKLRILTLHRKAKVLRRQTYWIYQDAPPEQKEEALKLYREAVRTLRRLVWLTWSPPFHLRRFVQKLREIYAPAIAECFERSRLLWNAFIEEGKNENK